MSNQRSSFALWVPRIIMLVGICLIVAAVFVARDSWSLRSKDTKVTGTIVEIDTNPDGARTGTWQYEFRGETYEHEGSTPGTNRTSDEGATHELYIDPDDPAKAKLAGFFGMWLIPTVLMVLGWAMLIGGVIALIVMRVVRGFRGSGSGENSAVQMQS